MPWTHTHFSYFMSQKVGVDGKPYNFWFEDPCWKVRYYYTNRLHQCIKMVSPAKITSPTWLQIMGPYWCQLRLAVDTSIWLGVTSPTLSPMHINNSLQSLGTIHFFDSSAMITTPSKRKLPRSYLPFIGNLIDRFSFSKLPTKKVVLQRLLFQIEHNHGAASMESASLTTQKELFALWEYAGYGDILKNVSNVLKQIRSLHESYKAINKTPLSRRNTESFKKKESLFLTSLADLFHIAQGNLKSSGLITKGDQDFLCNHWGKTIFTTADHVTRDAVNKNLARKEKSITYTLTQNYNPSATSPSGLSSSTVSPASPTPPLPAAFGHIPKPSLHYHSQTNRNLCHNTSWYPKASGACCWWSLSIKPASYRIPCQHTKQQWGKPGQHIHLHINCLEHGDPDLLHEMREQPSEGNFSFTCGQINYNNFATLQVGPVLL